MPQTTIIISCLEKADFVANGKYNLPLAGQIKHALMDLFIGAISPQNIISHWSELPFLNRIIAIFEHEDDAQKAYHFLQKSQKWEVPGLELPKSIKISLQENLLQRSKSTESLGENRAKNIERVKVSVEALATGDLAGYQEPRPKRLDMYADLLKSGVDISEYNSEQQTKEVQNTGSKIFTAPKLESQRTKSPTKTLFKPSLSINTSVGSKGNGAPPLSPTITLDQI